MSNRHRDQEEIYYMRYLATLLMTLMSLPNLAQAYSSLYGSGAHMGTQPCSYPMSRYEKFVRKASGKLQKLEYKLESEEARVESIKESIEELEEYIEGGMRYEVSEYVKRYGEELNYGLNYCNPACGSVQNIYFKKPKLESICEKRKPTLQEGEECGNPYDGDGYCFECEVIINQTKGARDKFNAVGLCKQNYITKSDELETVGDCKDYMEELAELHEDLKEAEKEQKETKKNLRALKRDISKEERKNARGDTEAGYCKDCAYYESENKAYSWIRDIGMPILGGLVMYKGVKEVSEINADVLAYTTSPSWAAGAIGAGFALNGIYGAGMSGLGAGAYGCSQMYGNGYGLSGTIAGAAALAGGAQYPGSYHGAFGYPQSMYSTPYGGGLFNAGILASGGHAGYNFGAGASAGFGVPGGYPGVGIPGVGGGYGYPNIYGGAGVGAGAQFGIGAQYGLGLGGQGFGLGGIPGTFPGSIPGGYPGIMCIQPPCPGGTSGIPGYPGQGSIGGGYNSQYYAQQMQLQQQQMQLQMQIQQEQAAKAQQWYELSAQMQALYQQMQYLQSSSYGGYGAGYGLGVSGGISIGIGAGVGVGVGTSVPGGTPNAVPGGTNTTPTTPIRGRSGQ